MIIMERITIRAVSRLRLWIRTLGSSRNGDWSRAMSFASLVRGLKREV